MTTNEKAIYINMDDKQAVKKVTDKIISEIAAAQKDFDSISIVNIGTDRSTGDSLGPLVGYKLKNKLPKNIKCFGDLENTVHAKNLAEHMNVIDPNSLVIAVDACLGRMDHVGSIQIGAGSIKPGSGVNKDLPPIGDIFITGIVNFGGYMDFLVLQNTRLSMVMKMAEVISEAVINAFSEDFILKNVLEHAFA